MFKTRLLRTSLTILGVSVGIGTIVFLVSLGYGLQTILIEKITTSESLLSLDVFPPESGEISLTAASLDELRKSPHVREVVGVALVPAQMIVGDSAANATANIIQPAYFRLSGLKVEAGNFFSSEDPNHVVISSTLAQLFGWGPLEAIGKNIIIDLYNLGDLSGADIKEKFKSFVISGIISGEGTAVYLSTSAFPDLNLQRFSQAKVRVENADALESTRQAILEKGFSVLALSDVVEQANKIFKVLQIILAVFGAAALLVSAIGMFNTMTIAFLERTQEIGIMRALGASRQDMTLLFVVESAIMGFLGGAMGIVIGYAAQFLSNFGMNILARSYGGAPMELFRTPIWLIIGIIIFSTIVGLFTGILPGKRAARLNPLDALKYK